MLRSDELRERARRYHAMCRCFPDDEKTRAAREQTATNLEYEADAIDRDQLHRQSSVERENRNGNCAAGRGPAYIPKVTWSLCAARTNLTALREIRCGGAI